MRPFCPRFVPARSSVALVQCRPERGDVLVCIGVVPRDPGDPLVYRHALRRRLRQVELDRAGDLDVQALYLRHRH